MSYIDVERSEEALQEEEEIREAVEIYLGTAATSVYIEILQTIQEFLQTMLAWCEWLFPLFFAYKEDNSLFWEDLQKIALFGVLFAISFLLLAPASRDSNGNRRKRRGLLHSTSESFRFLRPQIKRHTSIAAFETVEIKAALHESQATVHTHQHQHQHQQQQQHAASTICSGRVIMEEEETDQERFEKIYPTILLSRYRRLVLPPECKLVEKPKRPKETNNMDHKKSIEEKKEQPINDDENPAKRLQVYGRHFLALMKSLISFDYMGAGWTLINWLQALLRIRKFRRSSSHPELGDEQEEDDDDESRASSSQASVSNHSQVNIRKSITSRHASMTLDGNDQIHDLDHSFRSANMEEEKKEASISSRESINVRTPPLPPMAFDSLPQIKRRSSSESSVFPTASQASTEDVGEPDYSTYPSMARPLTTSTLLKTKSSSFNATASTTVGKRPVLGTKKKDLLDSYRALSVYNASLHNSSEHHSKSINTTASHNAYLTSQLTTSLHTLSHSCSTGSDDTIITKNYIPDDDSTIGDPCDEHDANLVPETNQLQRLDSDYSAFFFETANTQESLYRMSVEAPLPDKNGYIVGDEFLPDSNCTPLLVFVNSRSGPQQGHLLIAQLRRLLNPIQVWDLGTDGDPETVLESFCAFRNLRIMVCGGDGTVSWIIATLEKMNLKRKWPPIAILPLGTGNDLARIHGWGGGYNNESLIGILEQVADSYISLLDRWEMTIENRKGKVKEVKSFFNYLGVGADAQASLQVHMLRESKPQLFFSRVVNKAWYGVFGAEDIIKATSLNLPNEITLIADGVEVPLPPDSQGIIFLNIDSYAGGVSMWANGAKNIGGLHTAYGHASSDLGRRGHPPRHLRRTRSLEDLGMRRQENADFGLDRIDSMEDMTQLLTDDQRFERVTACNMPSSCQDGILDVVSIRGAFHLGQIRVGLSNAQRICQCREATIHIKRKVAVQTDGEPWRQNVCTLRVKRKSDSAIMLHKSEDDNGVETEMAKLLDWAEERKLITADTHYTLMKEFSRRIEYKTRQRRQQSRDNLMFSLKRAIGSSGAISSHGGNYEYPF